LLGKFSSPDSASLNDKQESKLLQFKVTAHVMATLRAKGGLATPPLPQQLSRQFSFIISE
ncbi:MAG: hypothetical protein ACR2NF_08730, partial [Pirellulales bacterium]